MSYSSFMGAGHAPMVPKGHGGDLLGPSDNSDSGSDTVGSSEARSDSDAAGSGERSSVDLDEGVDGADIAPDKVVRIGAQGQMIEEDEAEESQGSRSESWPVDVSDMVDVQDDEDESEDDAIGLGPRKVWSNHTEQSDEMRKKEARDNAGDLHTI